MPCTSRPFPAFEMFCDTLRSPEEGREVSRPYDNFSNGFIFSRQKLNFRAKAGRFAGRIHTTL